ncbi:MAG: chemotaxis protein CheW [Silvanigrellaceae bacterium]|nr:chemotaxis protein CheW [Silvanigrellaceae bacterium]
MLLPKKTRFLFDELSLQTYLDDTSSLDQEIKRHSGEQFIGFKIFEEEFLLPMILVREIIMLPTITYVPKAVFAVEGIISLRGEIMPVLNLRRFLRFSRGSATPSTRVIILQSDKGGFGIIVDEITEFAWLEKSEIDSIPQNFFPEEYRILSGVSRFADKIRGILDVEQLVQELIGNIDN